MTSSIDQQLTLTRIQQAIELLRPWLLFAAYLFCSLEGWWLIAVPLAAVSCLAGFIQMHDAIHRSLGLTKRGHDIALFLSGLLLLKSGHGLQVTHLRHHGRCLKQDDPEGACATWPFYRVLLEGPLHLFSMRFYSLKTAPNLRAFQILETLATICLVLAAVGAYLVYGSFTGLVYWAVAALMSATIPIWAAYIPHRLAPEHPAVRLGGKIAQVWTPVISSFAYHHLHHAFPKTPTALLPELAKLPHAANYHAFVHK
jgi:fatty acid desaturase